MFVAAGICIVVLKSFYNSRWVTRCETGLSQAFLILKCRLAPVLKQWYLRENPHTDTMLSHGPIIRNTSVLLFQFHWNYFEFSYFWTQALLRMHIHDPVSRLGSLPPPPPPPVLTSSFNRLKPPRSICQKVVNTGHYESEWLIEIFLKGCFGGWY